MGRKMTTMKIMTQEKLDGFTHPKDDELEKLIKEWQDRVKDYKAATEDVTQAKRKVRKLMNANKELYPAGYMIERFGQVVWDDPDEPEEREIKFRKIKTKEQPVEQQ